MQLAGNLWLLSASCYSLECLLSVDLILVQTIFLLVLCSYYGLFCIALDIC